jgi:hypothetical protein
MRERAGVHVKVHVDLACGHSYVEHRPPNVVWPVEGELRVCGALDHYPQQFAAHYSEQEEFPTSEECMPTKAEKRAGTVDT